MIDLHSSHISRINDGGSPPSGVRAIWEEYKVPISISGLSIIGVLLYGRFGGRVSKNGADVLSDLSVGVDLKGRGRIDSITKIKVSSDNKDLYALRTKWFKSLRRCDRLLSQGDYKGLQSEYNKVGRLERAISDLKDKMRLNGILIDSRL